MVKRSKLGAVWSLLWFRRTKGGIPVAVMIGEIAVTIGLVGDSVDISAQNTGVLLCVFGVVGALGAIFGRIKPSLPPLIASLIVVGVGSAMQNSYGGKVVAVMGISLSAVLFLLAYKRSEPLMASAAAISTGGWWCKFIKVAWMDVKDYRRRKNGALCNRITLACRLKHQQQWGYFLFRKPG